MSNRDIRSCRSYKRNGIWSRDWVEEESITVDLWDRSCRSWSYIDKSSIDWDTSILRERFWDDFWSSIFPDMDYFCSGISMLSCIRKGNTKVLTPCIFSLQDGARIEHSHSWSEISSNPFDRSIFFDDGSFGIEIIGISRPVLDGWISHPSIFSDINLDTPSMETRCPIFRSTTPLDIVSLCLIFEDDEGMFELSSWLSIHPKICLKWLRDADSSWDIEKCSPTPYCSMESWESVIWERDTFHEMFSHEILISPQSNWHIFEYYSEILEFLFETMIDDLTIILGSDSCEDLLFCLWDTEPIKCCLYFFWYLIPWLWITSPIRLGEVVDWVEIESIEWWSPGWSWFSTKYLEWSKSKIEHPWWLIKRSRNLTNHCFIDPDNTLILIYNSITWVESISIDFSEMYLIRHKRKL